MDKLIPRIDACFSLIKVKKGEIKEISFIELRRFFIQVSQNASKTSFLDFVEVCITLNFLSLKEEQHKDKFKIFLIYPELWKKLNKDTIDFYARKH